MSLEEVQLLREKNRIISQKNRSKHKQEYDQLLVRVKSFQDDNDSLRREAECHRNTLTNLKKRLLTDHRELAMKLSGAATLQHERGSIV